MCWVSAFTMFPIATWLWLGSRYHTYFTWAWMYENLFAKVATSICKIIYSQKTKHIHKWTKRRIWQRSFLDLECHKNWLILRSTWIHISTSSQKQFDTPKGQTVMTVVHSSPHGLYSLRRRRLISIGIPIINLRRSSDRLRFIMGIPIPVRRRLFSE